MVRENTNHYIRCEATEIYLATVNRFVSEKLPASSL